MARIGRETQVIDCRETAGLGLGGGLSQRGTFSEAEKPDIIVLSMGPSTRHITKPVCEITYGLREAGFQVSVLVLKAGIGPPEEYPYGPMPGAGGVSGISPEEEDQIARHKLAIIHHGNVPRHFVHKTKVFLRNVNIPAIVICQAPADFEDFAKAGVRTRVVEPEKPETKGTIVDIVTEVIRGQTCPQGKIDEIVRKVKYWFRKLAESRA
ncbi:MAG: Methyl-coenzyme M reductase I operon protein C [Candidatus Bathyarchaeota archaeon BA2]|nr:MAG: Methyl-coenzyme M reductase I operon protein C [Candidatus Bathyarchaeota archaeon BA2]